jgi:protein-tyrosine phosphatase
MYRSGILKVLIVCTGNTCRSPMGEGILKHLSKKYNTNIEVRSAGIFALDGDRASSNAILALDSIGIDISNHISNQLHGGMIEEADIVLTMTDNQKEAIIKRFPKSDKKVYSLNYYAFGIEKDIEDPYGGTLKDYEMARDEIFRAMEKIAAG